jgi:hypothetical protein
MPSSKASSRRRSSAPSRRKPAKPIISSAAITRYASVCPVWCVTPCRLPKSWHITSAPSSAFSAMTISPKQEHYLCSTTMPRTPLCARSSCPRRLGTATGVLFLDGPVAKPAQGPVPYQVGHVTPGLEHRKRLAAEIAHHLGIRAQTGVGVKVALLPLTQEEPCSFQPWNGHLKPPEPVANRQEVLAIFAATPGCPL